MKIISIGTDEKLLNKESSVFKRIQEYSQIAEKYYCFVITKNSNLKIIEFGNFKVIPVLYKYKALVLFGLSKKIKQENIENKNDIVVSSQDPFEVGFFSWIISKTYRYNFSVQIHTDISSRYFRYESMRNFLQYLIFRFVIKKAKSIRVVSGRIKNYLVDKLNIDNNKIFLAPIFVNLESTKPLSTGEGKGVRPNI